MRARYDSSVMRGALPRGSSTALAVLFLVVKGCAGPMRGRQADRDHPLYGDRLATGLALAAVLVSCTGKDDGLGRTCTQMGCVPMALIHFAPPPETAGRYEIALRVDGVAGACTLELAAPEPPVVEGEGTTVPASNAVLSDGCPRLEARMQDSGGRTAGLMLSPEYRVEVDADAGELVYVGLPQHVDISIAADGRTIATGAFDLRWTPEEINGPGCGACPRAHDTLAVEW
jgi:hypothetical protein